MKSRGQTPGLWSMLRVKICNSNRAAVCTRHTTAQTHQADLYAVALISIGRFDPLYGFMQNRRKLCARPDLFYWKQARIIISVCIRVAHYRRKSIPNGYARSSLCKLIFHFRDIMALDREASDTDRRPAKNRARWQTKTNNEDECTPEWVDRKIVLAA